MMLYNEFKKWRKQGPIFWHAPFHCWVVIGFKEAQTLLKSTALSADVTAVLAQTTFPVASQPSVQPLIDYFQQWLFFSDPPYHQHLRSIINPFFSNARIKGLRPKITGFVNQYTRKHKNAFDFHASIARPLPVCLMAELLSLPTKDWQHFAKWNEQLVPFISQQVRTPAIVKAALQAQKETHTYLQTFIRQRHGTKTDGMFHEIFALLDASDYLDIENFWIIISMLLGTGSQTLSHLLSNGLYSLLTHPDQYQHLVENIELVPQAVQEMLRFQPPVLSMMRRATTDLALDDQMIKKGDYVRIMIGAANRDPLQFTKPDQFDITRESVHHLAFGTGLHHCLGNQLAKTTAEIFFTEFLTAFPKLTIEEGSVQWLSDITFHGINKMIIKPTQP